MSKSDRSFNNITFTLKLYQFRNAFDEKEIQTNFKILKFKDFEPIFWIKLKKFTWKEITIERSYLIFAEEDPSKSILYPFLSTYNTYKKVSKINSNRPNSSNMTFCQKISRSYHKKMQTKLFSCRRMVFLRDLICIVRTMFLHNQFMSCKARTSLLKS